jgi:hypothetical protein
MSRKNNVFSVKFKQDITTDTIYINIKSVRASAPKTKPPGNTRPHDKYPKDPPRHPIQTQNPMSIT